MTLALVTPGRTLPPAPQRSRPRAMRTAATAAALVLFVALAAFLVPEGAIGTDPAARMVAPSLAHLFGTDMLGRDMALRTLEALGTSLWIGLFAAAASTLIAFILGVLATTGRIADTAIGALTELTIGLPHIVLLLLVAYALGGGATAVVIAVGLTHWPRLSRVVRAETERLATSDYVAVSRALGRSDAWIAWRHMAPHLAPQLLAGFVLIFPHAILHEAALSFLGVGVEPHMPAIGIILAESLRGLSAGYWWLAVLPGAALLAVALCFEVLGEALRRAFSLTEAQV